MYEIAKLFSLSYVAVLKWVRKEADLIEDVPAHAESKIVMIDEIPSSKSTLFMNSKIDQRASHISKLHKQYGVIFA